ncbi:MAG: retropepsin-like domain-containing protein [Armatimonadetes bacterium]|nr:retropepsin-like domain-containing protein [Armatimonadota bacterium]
MSIVRVLVPTAVIASATLVMVGMSQQNNGLLLRSECPETVTVPFTQGKHPGPLIEVEIGGKKRRMMMDTGAGASVVQQSLVDELGLRPFMETTARDPGGKNSMKVALYRIPEIKIGTATFYGATCFVQPAATRSQVADDTIADGVLSFTVFQNQLLVVDYPNKTISIGPGSLPQGAAKYTLRSNTPVVDVDLSGVKVPCQIDTGAQGGLMVPLPLKSKLPLTGEPRRAGQTRTLFNSMDVWEADLKGSVEVCGVQIQVPTVEMHEGFPIGNIGGKLLQNFVLTVDQKNQRIQLVPRKE